MVFVYKISKLIYVISCKIKINPNSFLKKIKESMLHLDIITFRRNLVKADPHFLLFQQHWDLISF